MFLLSLFLLVLSSVVGLCLSVVLTSDLQLVQGVQTVDEIVNSVDQVGQDISAKSNARARFQGLLQDWEHELHPLDETNDNSNSAIIRNDRGIEFKSLFDLFRPRPKPDVTIYLTKTQLFTHTVKNENLCWMTRSLDHLPLCTYTLDRKEPEYVYVEVDKKSSISIPAPSQVGHSPVYGTSTWDDTDDSTEEADEDAKNNSTTSILSSSEPTTVEPPIIGRRGALEGTPILERVGVNHGVMTINDNVHEVIREARKHKQMTVTKLVKKTKYISKTYTAETATVTFENCIPYYNPFQTKCGEHH